MKKYSKPQIDIITFDVSAPIMEGASGLATTVAPLATAPTALSFGTNYVNDTDVKSFYSVDGTNWNWEAK